MVSGANWELLAHSFCKQPLLIHIRRGLMSSVPSSRHRSLREEPFKCLNIGDRQNSSSGRSPFMGPSTTGLDLLWSHGESLVSLLFLVTDIQRGKSARDAGVYSYIALPSGTFWIFIFLGHSYKYFHSTALGRGIPKESEMVTWKQGILYYKYCCGWIPLICSFLLVIFVLYTDSCSFILF